MSAGWIGIDPGGAETGIVLRIDDWCPAYTVVVRGDLPMGAYIREVCDVARTFLDRLVAESEDNVAVEDLNPPSPHLGITSVKGLLATAQVLGGVLAVWPSAVVVPPGGHGSGPFAAYPTDLRPTRPNAKGKDRLRHARSAWDVAVAAPRIQRLEGVNRPMKRYVIYGASDDLIEVEGALREEYNVVGDGRGTFTLADSDGGGVRVHVVYEDSGCWSVGVSPLEEDQSVPDGWAFELDHGDGDAVPTYSMALLADVSDDAVLTWEGDES